MEKTEEKRVISPRESKKSATTTVSHARMSVPNQKWINLMEPDENFRQHTTDLNGSTVTTTTTTTGGKRLCLRGRDLKPIDPEIFKLDLMLTSLELSPDYRSCLSHKLDAVPQAIGNLVHLRELKLDTNDLKSVPAELASLVHLERLSLSNNSLKSLPDELAKLKSLRSLHLANNAFEVMPACVFDMSSLAFLDMTSNKLTSLDKSLLRLSGSLLFLSVFDNYLTRIDGWIGRMTRLEQFWFGSNKLSRVPREMANLSKIDWKDDYLSIILDGNPIETPPICVCREGLEAIEKWYAENANRPISN